jgi:hypothetical protein
MYIAFPCARPLKLCMMAWLETIVGTKAKEREEVIFISTDTDFFFAGTTAFGVRRKCVILVPALQELIYSLLLCLGGIRQHINLKAENWQSSKQ